MNQTPSVRVGYCTVIFKMEDSSSEFSFSRSGCFTKAKELSSPYLPISAERTEKFTPFPMLVARSERQSRPWFELRSPSGGGGARGVMVKAMDCKIVVSEFVLQSRYYVHFRARYEPPYPPCYGLNSTTTVLQGDWLWHLIAYKGWYAIKQRNQTSGHQFHFHRR